MENPTIPATPPATTPVAKTKNNSLWKLRCLTSFLVLLLIALLAGGSFGGYKGYTMLQDKDREITSLKEELDKLKSDKNLSTSDLQKRIDTLQSQSTDLTNKNKNLENDLKTARDRIAELTPKDIKDIQYETLISINKSAGDTWEAPIYADLTGDGRQDGIFSYHLSGAGKYLNVYVYSYLDNKLTQILKAEEYPKGSISIASDNTLEIRYTTGAPDSPEIKSAKFKWDIASKKMVKVS